jgi:hypothetical protein
MTRTLCAAIATLSLGVVVAQTPQPTPRKNPAVTAVVELADKLDRVDAAFHAKLLVQQHDACDFSRVFAHRGAGIGSAVRAGHKDAIEFLVKDWAGPRPPTEQELTEHRADLLRVARVMRVMAELAPHRIDFYVGAKDEPRRKEWQRVTGEFKTVSRKLEKAIGSGDAARTRKAALRVNQVCNACHKIVGI